MHLYRPQLEMLRCERNKFYLQLFDSSDRNRPIGIVSRVTSWSTARKPYRNRQFPRIYGVRFTRSFESRRKPEIQTHHATITNNCTAMCVDQATTLTIDSATHIDMNPLMIAGSLRESIDPILVDRHALSTIPGQQPTSELQMAHEVRHLRNCRSCGRASRREPCGLRQH